MHYTQLIPFALFGAELIVPGAAVPAIPPFITPAPQVVRRDASACVITPTASFPNLCPALLGGASPTYAVYSPPASDSSSAPAGGSVSCSMQDEDPGMGINSAYCVCTSGGTTTTAKLLSNVPSTAMVTASCDYPTFPGAAAVVSVTNGLGPATTNTALCQICTPYAINGDDCTTINGCTPQAAAATVTAGTSPVHVGTLTGSALYTTISSALESLCPPATGTTQVQCVQTDSVTVGGIDYFMTSDNPDDTLGRDGELTIKAIGNYNVTSLRDAMINSAASSIQYSAMNKNCYNQKYTQWDGKKAKRDPLGAPMEPISEDVTLCNAGGYTEVQYWDKWWKYQAEPGATDALVVELSFQIGPQGDYLCDFIEALSDVLAVIEPEFAIEDVELGEALTAVCQEEENDEEAKSVMGRDVGHWKRGPAVVDYFVDPPQDIALKKRMVSAGMDQYVKDLWDAAPASNKVAAGAPPAVFKLDYDTSATYTTVECYGCTAVVLMSGKTVIIGHFTEDQFKPGSSNDALFGKGVIDVLESLMLANKNDLGENPFTAIFSPGTNGVFTYKPRIVGPGSISESIHNDFPTPATAELIDYVKLFQTANQFEDTSAGKIVVEWKAPNDAACHYSNGVGTLNLFAEGSWYIQAHIDQNGNVITPGSDSCSLAADNGEDDGNAAGSSG